MISYIKLFGIGVPQMIQGLSHIIENTGSFSISICYSQHVPSSTSDVLDLEHEMATILLDFAPVKPCFKAGW